MKKYKVGLMKDKKNDSVQKAVDELFGNRTTFYNNNSWIIDPDNKLKLE